MKLNAYIAWMLFLFPVFVFADDCKIIELSQNKLIEVTAMAEGPRGSLKFPAIINTGATNSFIPKSISDGISIYSKKQKKMFTTGAGDKEFLTTVISKLSFLGVEFDDVEVAITDKTSRYVSEEARSFLARSKTLKGDYTKTGKEEIAIIGMSELSKIKFSYKNNQFTVCK